MPMFLAAARSGGHARPAAIAVGAPGWFRRSTSGLGGVSARDDVAGGVVARPDAGVRGSTTEERSASASLAPVVAVTVAAAAPADAASSSRRGTRSAKAAVTNDAPPRTRRETRSGATGTSRLRPTDVPHGPPLRDTVTQNRAADTRTETIVHLAAPTDRSVGRPTPDSA